MKFTDEFKVNANDVDFNRIVSVSNIFRYMQDTANLQMEHDSPSYDELFNQGYAFVLSRMNIVIHKSLLSHEIFTSETWACESRGYSFNRCYRLLKGDDVIAEATSIWALAGVNDRKLHRNGEVELDYAMDEMLEMGPPSKIKIPQTLELTLVGERTVEYADIDMNGHMNNTKYPDFICSYIGNMEGQRVVNMNISFINEAKLGETLKIYHATEGDSHFIRTLRENGTVNVEAEIVTEAI